LNTILGFSNGSFDLIFKLPREFEYIGPTCT
jgi:hypothetical protein